MFHIIEFLTYFSISYSEPKLSGIKNLWLIMFYSIKFVPEFKNRLNLKNKITVFRQINKMLDKGKDFLFVCFVWFTQWMEIVFMVFYTTICLTKL